MSHEQEIADNRRLWDAWTAIHTTGPFYDVQRFRDDPTDVRIEPWEREEVGDVDGKTLLHVQCHFGLDTLSWARLGAAHVTGVDFSEPAIAFATELARETGLAERSRFVVSDVYDLPGPLAGETFDVVYTGRGATRLAPRSRAVGARRCRVRASGRDLLHARRASGDVGARRRAEQASGLRLGYDYWGGETLTFPVEGSYADPTADVDAEVEHGWNHSLGEVVTLLAEQGLRDRASGREARAGLARAVPRRSRRRRARVGARGARVAPAHVLAADAQGLGRAPGDSSASGRGVEA